MKGDTLCIHAETCIVYIIISFCIYLIIINCIKRTEETHYVKNNHL